MSRFFRALAGSLLVAAAALPTPAPAGAAAPAAAADGPSAPQATDISYYYDLIEHTAVRPMTLMPWGMSRLSMMSRSSLRSSPSTRRDTPPPRGLFGMSTR